MKWLLASAAGLLIMIASQKIEPRGIRNNNPGNIRFSKYNNWLGQVGSDGEYAIFDKPENGIRAIAKLLNNYNSRYGLSTVNGLISRWAPSSENNTAAYVASVANQVGVDPLQRLNLGDVMPSLIAAIIKHENGVQPYSIELIGQGVAAA